jgi:5-amino-6-(5-phosphoribosylamino)uracil reductase
MGGVDRPRVLLSVAMSVDGHIDDGSADRLILSNAADLDRVDAQRAAVDAILVGANTVRRDDPRLLVRSAERVAARLAAGRPAQPVKVAISGRGDLDPGARFFTTGDGAKIVYLPSGIEPPEFLAGLATVVPAGAPLDPHRVLADLAGRGVRLLLVEGGTAVHTLFLTAGLVDELQLAVAPLFVGDPAAPRFVGAGAFPHDAGHRMRLLEARPVGDVVLLRYGLGPSGLVSAEPCSSTAAHSQAAKPR